MWVLLPFRLRKLDQITKQEENADPDYWEKLRGTTMSNSRKTWRAELWQRAAWVLQASESTMTLLRRTKVRTVPEQGRRSG